MYLCKLKHIGQEKPIYCIFLIALFSFLNYVTTMYFFSPLKILLPEIHQISSTRFIIYPVLS